MKFVLYFTNEVTMAAVSGYTRCVKRLDEVKSKARPILSDQLDQNCTPAPPFQSNSK